MGRLEDIAERNRRANAGAPHGGIVNVFAKLSRDKPAEPDAPFTLKRTKRMSPLVVLPVLLAIGVAVGLTTCSRMGHKTEYEQRMMGETR